MTDRILLDVPRPRRAGRPRATADALRYRRDIRLSANEWADLVERACQAGLRPGVLARRLLTGHQPRAVPSVANRTAWVDLARVHANLNQLVHVLNDERLSGSTNVPDMAEILNILRDVAEQTRMLRAEMLGVSVP